MCRYGVKRLKLKCEAFLASNLTVDNVSECLLIADTYAGELLRQEVIKFVHQQHVYVFANKVLLFTHIHTLIVSCNCKLFTTVQNWKAFEALNSALAASVLREVITFGRAPVAVKRTHEESVKLAADI